MVVDGGVGRSLELELLKYFNEAHFKRSIGVAVVRRLMRKFDCLCWGRMIFRPSLGALNENERSGWALERGGGGRDLEWRRRECSEELEEGSWSTFSSRVGWGERVVVGNESVTFVSSQDRWGLWNWNAAATAGRVCIGMEIGFSVELPGYQEPSTDPLSSTLFSPFKKLTSLSLSALAISARVAVEVAVIFSEV